MLPKELYNDLDALRKSIKRRVIDLDLLENFLDKVGQTALPTSRKKSTREERIQQQRSVFTKGRSKAS